MWNFYIYFIKKCVVARVMGNLKKNGINVDITILKSVHGKCVGNWKNWLINVDIYI